MGAPDPLDFLDIDRLLTDEERQVRGLVREWVRDNVLPGIEDWFESGSFPKETALQLGSLGLLGMHLDGYGCLGANAVSYGVRGPRFSTDAATAPRHDRATRAKT